MRNLFIPGLLALILATGCSNDAPTAVRVEDAAHFSRAAGQGRDQVPFKARVEGRTESVRISPVLLRVDFDGFGQATHLGRTHAQASLDVDAAFAFEGEVALTAADGSQLFLLVTGQLVLREFPIFDVAGAYEVTGGTGRFVGATGGGTLEGELDFDADEASIELTGTVSSVGSGRGAGS
jgi:hypothetical protein